MEPNPKRSSETDPPRMPSRPSPDALRQWVDSRYPKAINPQRMGRDRHADRQANTEPSASLKERVEEWGAILLILGVLLVWARLLLAAVGIFPLF